ncbi:hypothetical protein PINS_up006569 [Pythium insidiosum]|nr:hypothetical protein PINS_up006569 [Pythium insidiosum]
MFCGARLGLLDAIHHNSQRFCVQPPQSQSQPQPSKRETQVTLVRVRNAGVDAMVFNGLELDLRHAAVDAPIESLAQDGGGHDPRFILRGSVVRCACAELAAFAQDHFRRSLRPLRLWDPYFARVSATARDDPSSVCAIEAPLPSSLSVEAGPTDTNEDDAAAVIEIHERAVVLARRDDHNPFFQVSHVLNAWILQRALAWDPQTTPTRVVQLDAGYPSALDELQSRLLATPGLETLRGATALQHKRVRFQSDVLFPPFETHGPMMQHLDDNEPCFDSALFKEFRAESLRVMGASEASRQTATAASPSASPIVVTVISRRNYEGRAVQRRWLNENEILDRLRQQYANASPPMVFQSVDFVTLPLAQQMQLMLDSDVVIGMHGAGLVNVLWTRPGTLVVEIFPRWRRRWGFRNLCQFIGCEWHEFRGGRDTGLGDNASDKTLEYEEWLRFLAPLLQQVSDTRQRRPPETQEMT